MLIVMAGLPGTGKSTIAARLARAVDAVVLSKDAVRSALFPQPVLDYSRAEDNIAMAAIYHAAAYIRLTSPERAVILDGRTFLRAEQVRDLLGFAASVNEVPHIIECVCDDGVARQRLEDDLARGEHPAGNRTFDLYRARRAAAEPIAVPRLVLDTGETSLDECVERCLVYLKTAP
jgi:adenylylsulfate kinase